MAVFYIATTTLLTAPYGQLTLNTPNLPPTGCTDSPYVVHQTSVNSRLLSADVNWMILNEPSCPLIQYVNQFIDLVNRRALPAGNHAVIWRFRYPVVLIYTGVSLSKAGHGLANYWTWTYVQYEPENILSASLRDNSLPTLRCTWKMIDEVCDEPD